VTAEDYKLNCGRWKQMALVL